mmetsp:Transcript_33740/g.104175  ORF Transcript_33740/g.104175 Transcript_33740/m.104175 type:complete len:207 (-) Transcript_33740:74-694(-)
MRVGDDVDPTAPSSSPSLPRGGLRVDEGRGGSAARATGREWTVPEARTSFSVVASDEVCTVRRCRGKSATSTHTNPFGIASRRSTATCALPDAAASDTCQMSSSGRPLEGVGADGAPRTVSACCNTRSMRRRSTAVCRPFSWRKLRSRGGVSCDESSRARDVGDVTTCCFLLASYFTSDTTSASRVADDAPVPPSAVAKPRGYLFG